MTATVIWNISQNKNFPVEIWKHPKFALELKKLSINEIESINFEKDSINILFFDISVAEYQAKKNFLIKMMESITEITVMIFTGFEFNESDFGKYSNNTLYIQTVRPNELKHILDKTIQAEFYKKSAQDIGQACLSNVGFYEGLFELANKENRDNKDTLKAFELILDYEKTNKANRDEINRAMNKVEELKDSEMILLVDTLKATEKLNILREVELKEAIAIKDATEKALQFSRIEEINMQKIIKAQDKIFEYTDKEIRELIQENKDLKQKLDGLNK